MRLIDADKLEATAVLGVQLQHADSRYYYFYEEETIEKAPIIKAIPAEWIENQAKEWELHNELYARVIRSLIEKWEKENDLQKT